jgi:quinol monooxygenase YgiN
MFTIYVTYKGSDRAAVEGFYREIRELGIDTVSRREDGNVRYEYYWSAERDDELFLLEIWETKEAQQIHSQQAHFKKLGELKSKYGIETEIEIL